MKYITLLISLLLLFTSCEETNYNSGTSSTDKTTVPTEDVNKTPTKPIISQDDEKAEELGKELEYATFNDDIIKARQQGEEWVLSPLSVMLKFTGANVDSNVKNVRTKKLGPGEEIDDVLVTVEEEGLMDDSVKASLTMLRMRKENSIWQVYKATRAWKCWPGRGHQEYGGEPCS